VNNSKYPFVKIPADYLESIHNGNPDTPTLYFHTNPIIRHVFWSRLQQIHSFIQTMPHERNKCLDFGGGSGVFLPMLCQLFDQVVLIDLHPEQARVIKEKYHLENCEIIESDIFDFSPITCDAIIAADVLEHFRDTTQIVAKLETFMAENAAIYTSLPSENALYQFLRLIFRIEKPDDHYASARGVEKVFCDRGYRQVKHKHLPVPGLSYAELFSVSAWLHEH
jgi:predicted TPR repeat methyltransferase